MSTTKVFFWVILIRCLVRLVFSMWLRCVFTLSTSKWNQDLRNRSSESKVFWIIRTSYLKQWLRVPLSYVHRIVHILDGRICHRSYRQNRYVRSYGAKLFSARGARRALPNKKYLPLPSEAEPKYFDSTRGPNSLAWRILQSSVLRLGLERKG